MTTTTKISRDKVLAEIDALPEEYLPFLLQMMRAFRESVTLKPAGESFRQGWCEAQRRLTYPVEELWDGVDAQ
jgi:hypothetical protein